MTSQAVLNHLASRLSSDKKTKPLGLLDSGLVCHVREKIITAGRGSDTKAFI